MEKIEIVSLYPKPLKARIPLKRSKLARKPRKLAKRAKRRKRTKLPTLKKLRAQLWELCRQITAKRYPDVCFTCGKPVSGSNRQLGHFIPRSTCGLYLRYDLRNLRWQCYYDNINLGGNGSMFYRKLVEENGQEYVDQIFADKLRQTKETREFYTNLIAEYQEKVDNLPRQD